MGVEIVHEEEERLAQGAGRRRRRARDRGGVPLGDRQSHGADGILVALEPAVEPVLAIEHRRADHGRRVVARLGQDGGEGRGLVRHSIDAVVTNAMPVGEQPAHQRDVRRQRDGYGCDGVLENDTFGGPAVQVGSRGALTAVAAESIRPGRVDADQQHRRLRARLARPPASAILEGGRSHRHQGWCRPPRRGPPAAPGAARRARASFDPRSNRKRSGNSPRATDFTIRLTPLRRR